MAVDIPGEKLHGYFISRPNRFEAFILINGNIEVAHVPNTGRMNELLHEGVEVVVSRSSNKNRKTGYTLLYVNKNGKWIFIHSALANKIFEDAVISCKIDWLNKDEEFAKIHREVYYGKSRIDFMFEGIQRTLVEIKCGTYEENGIVMFPDAPTLRGRRHVEELIKSSTDGYRAAAVIVSFIDYVEGFKPNYKIDMEFGNKLREAYNAGIIVKAYRCSIDFNNIAIDKEIPVTF